MNSLIYKFAINFILFTSFLIIASSIIIYFEAKVIEKDTYRFSHFLKRDSKILKIHTKKWIVASENLGNSHNEAFMSLVVDNGKFCFFLF